MSHPPSSLHITMPDGSIWAVPVLLIAEHRAKCYAHKFGNDLDRSLHDDTLPLFFSHHPEISDWASNNMNWDEVAASAVCVKPAETPDYQDGWVNGPFTVVV